MNRDEFRDRLLAVMESKRHWAWSKFTTGEVPADLLHIHFEQEYESYVRDFPVLIGRAYVQCPVAEVRRELAENLYEEETGGLVAKKPHPELFLEYPRGLGMDMSLFNNIELLPGANAYRAVINECTERRGWEIAAAATTLFIEGTPYERGEIDDSAAKRPAPPLEKHPLVVHYGLPIESLALTKAHREVEGEHRRAAWEILLEHVGSHMRKPVVSALSAMLRAWLAYRDDVAAAVGLKR